MSCAARATVAYGRGQSWGGGRRGAACWEVAALLSPSLVAHVAGKLQAGHLGEGGCHDEQLWSWLRQHGEQSLEAQK